MSSEPIAYIGTELDLFQHAVHWKRYFARHLRPYVQGKVLDAGCGMGVNAAYLVNDRIEQWTFLEPDPRLLEKVPQYVPKQLSNKFRSINGTTTDLKGGSFDTILYLDVIEHIEDAKGELRRAYDLLSPGGHLLVLVPAFNFLYSPFDKAIGHFKRYDKAILTDELPKEFVRVKTRYLDSIAFFLSLANKWFLARSAPTLKQVLFWDRIIVPASYVIDPLVLHSFGKSLISVSRKPS